MKPDKQATMDGIMEIVQGLTSNQRRTLLQAMKNPYFFLIAFKLADADESKIRCAYRFIGGLMGGKDASS